MNSLQPKTLVILTRREIDILLCVAQGLSSKQIAEKLFLSIKTVGHHRSNILEKTGAGNLAAVVRDNIGVLKK
ncbi:MAG: helix-turn-helix transcriptional regulator [Bacteroidota bacterium]